MGSGLCKPVAEPVSQSPGSAGSLGMCEIPEAPAHIQSSSSTSSGTALPPLRAGISQEGKKREEFNPTNTSQMTMNSYRIGVALINKVNLAVKLTDP